MTQYNAEYFLNRLETTLHNIEENVTDLQVDVKEIQINMAEFRHLATLVERMTAVETKAIEANIELTKLKEQFGAFKDSVTVNKLGLSDMIKGAGALIGWIAAAVSTFFALK